MKIIAGIIAVTMLVGLFGSSRSRKRGSETVQASLGGLADAIRLLAYGLFSLIFIYLAGLAWHASAG